MIDHPTLSHCPSCYLWYQGNRPGALVVQCSRQEQTVISHFRSGHLRSVTYKDRVKVFPVYSKCATYQAMPDHVLNCLKFTREDVCEDLLYVLDIIRIARITDFI